MGAKGRRLRAEPAPQGIARRRARSPGPLKPDPHEGASRAILPSVRSKVGTVILASFLVVSMAAAPAAARPPFKGTVSVVDDETRELMVGRSWRQGCPVGLDKLRVLGVRYWGFDRKAHWGRLVVHRAFAWKVVGVFRTLYEERYPVRRVRLVDRYAADDLKSMKDDNTSAFNCRWRAGQPGVWSMHAYGKALDLNPLENPYVSGDHVSPPGGREYVDRSRNRKGMIHAGDTAVRAFEDIGWEWGGAWTGSVVDYQHFSSNNH